MVATVRGTVHEHYGLPLQDAAGIVGNPESGEGVIAISVADGHGDAQHARSARGAELAVKVAGAVATEAAQDLAEARSVDEVSSMARSVLIPALNVRWRDAVGEDLADNPVEVNDHGRGRAPDSLLLYGTTLLVAILAFPWLVLCQIGDGDIVVVDMDGLAERPVPGDPTLDGQHTTSMCQRDAERAFRYSVMDLRSRPVAVLLLATDGFGNAQTVQPWHQQVGADVVHLARERGIEWIERQLPVWVARCASGEGSGDDTSMALLMRHDLASV